MPNTNPTFTGSLVRMEIKNRVLRELALASKGDAIEMAKADMAQALAAFLTKHFVTESKTEQHIELRLGLELILPTDKVPAGVAHTEIIFQTKAKA